MTRRSLVCCLAALLALGMLVTHVWAQASSTAPPPGPGAAGEAPPPAPKAVLTVTIPLGSEEQRALGAELEQAAQIDGAVVQRDADLVIRFLSLDSAVRFFRSVPMRLDRAAGGPWQRLDLRNADPRHVRSMLVSEVLARSLPVQVRCTVTPPQVLLQGPPPDVARLADLTAQMDVPPPPALGPEDVVRAYLERWLMVPEDRDGPDVDGMYALTTQDARRQISLMEFRMLISQTVVSPPAGAPGPEQRLLPGGPQANAVPGPMMVGVRAEINDVYPALFSRERARAVVGYSLTWFPVFSPDWLAQATPVGPPGPGGPGGVPGFLGGANQGQFGVGPRPAMGPMGPPAMGLHRSQGVVVRDRDGAWRLPMLFDPQSRTWLTPLSPRLATLIAPELVAQGAGAPR